MVTVHDLGPLMHPEFFGHNRPWVMERALKQAVDKADAVVAISQATADEILMLHPQARDRVRVVRSGVSAHFFDPPDMSALDDLDLPPADVPFVLAAGKISPRKNIQGLLRAMKTLGTDLPHHLVLTGGNGWDVKLIEEELADGTLEGRVHMVGFVSDAALRALYHRAAIYVHPSLYEGFGLTLLEAMASNVPVVTSNLSSLPEVAGDAAWLVNPSDPEEIAAAIRGIAEDPVRADAMRQAGQQRARTFSWGKTATGMIDIYREVAGA